jgi:hypothetical protein
MLWKTPIIQWDNVGETLLAYFMSLTSLCKNHMGKIKRKTYTCVHIALLKIFQWEILIKLVKGREYSVMQLSRIIYKDSPPKPCKSLSFLIAMPLKHLSNIAKGNDLMNKPAWLSQDFICKILISPFRWSSCG